MSAVITNPQSDIDSMRRQEREAVESIKKYLIDGYDFRRSKVNPNANAKAELQNPGPFPQAEKFWDGIISAFVGYIAEINQKYSDMFNISECSEPKTRRRKSSADDGSFWIEEDLIDDFKKYFSMIETQHLRCSPLHSRCMELFQQLIETIETAISPISPTSSNSPNSPDNSDTDSLNNSKKISILGRTNFRYISKMLDINDNTICSLLPFLLTAYVYTFRNNRFMNRGDTSVEGAFSDEDVETIRVSETKKKLEVLSKCFGLFDCQIKFPASKGRPIKHSDSKSELDNQFSCDDIKYSSKYPYLEHREVLDSVFAIWCGIVCGICECEASQAYPAFYKKVDLVLCVKLYLYYMDNARYQKLMSEGFPSETRICEYILLRYASTPPFMPYISFRFPQEIRQ